MQKNVRIPPESHEKLVKLSKSWGVSQGTVVTLLIERAYAQLEKEQKDEPRK